MIPFPVAFVASFVGFSIAELMFFGIARLLGRYAIVPERRCFMYVLFGKVVAPIDEPGLHFLLPRMGWLAFIVNRLGTRHVLDMRLGKVVNRLLQVTSAIKQDGANQVSIIASTTERRAAIEFAEALAMRPQLAGAASRQRSQSMQSLVT